MTEYRLGTLAGLRLSAAPSALATMAGVWVLGSAAALVLGVTLPLALAVGVAVVLIHWASDLWHQLGHAWAARQTGHPMIGVRFWGPLSASLYPADEPPLPAAVHIRRALGGAPLSGLLAVGAAMLALLASGGVVGGLLWFLAVENLLVFSLGALLPLGFTDGSTLLHWWGKR